MVSRAKLLLPCKPMEEGSGLLAAGKVVKTRKSGRSATKPVRHK